MNHESLFMWAVQPWFKTSEDGIGNNSDGLHDVQKPLIGHGPISNCHVPECSPGLRCRRLQSPELQITSHDAISCGPRRAGKKPMWWGVLHW